MYLTFHVLLRKTKTLPRIGLPQAETLIIQKVLLKKKMDDPLPEKRKHKYEVQYQFFRKKVDDKSPLTESFHPIQGTIFKFEFSTKDHK